MRRQAALRRRVVRALSVAAILVAPILVFALLFTTARSTCKPLPVLASLPASVQQLPLVFAGGDTLALASYLDSIAVLGYHPAGLPDTNRAQLMEAYNKVNDLMQQHAQGLQLLTLLPAGFADTVPSGALSAAHLTDTLQEQALRKALGKVLPPDAQPDTYAFLLDAEMQIRGRYDLAPDYYGAQHGLDTLLEEIDVLRCLSRNAP